ncbi:hypothetical protein CHUAL_011493 [Chamberlinius hualienensis]
MGKLKKMTMAKQTRTMSLVEQMAQSEHFELVRGRVKSSKQRKQEDEEVVPNKLTKKILASARQQQNEMEEESGFAEGSRRKSQSSNRPKVALLSKNQNGSSDSESEIDENDHNIDYEYLDIDEEDENALALFMNPNPPARRTLADIIMEKITEKKTELQTQFSDVGSIQTKVLDEKVVDVFTGVGKVLAIYRSGKLPKAFKIIPSLSNWEQILYLTQPERWSAASLYMATRIFSSNLKEEAAQKFCNLVLLPRIRDDIQEFKRLNVHLYQALCKSLFKPGAFYKGFLLPLCAEGTCTLREAVIISSVLSKNSIPLLHSAAALLKIAEMDYNGANSIFIQTLIKKKYALPYKVIDGLVYHFIKFQHDKRNLPVLWHQALLAFVQHYKEDISFDQKEAIHELLKVQVHFQITPEIRKELQSSKSRGEVGDDETGAKGNYMETA